MKHALFITLIFILIIPTTNAQDMTSTNEGFDEASIESGGYGAPIFKMTRINESDAVLSGAKGTWIIDHNYALGGSLLVLSNNIDYPSYSKALEFGYGGVTFDYIYKPMDKIAITAGVLLGGGIIDFEDNAEGSDGVFIGEPEVSAQYQFTENFRAALSASYRGVTNTNLSGISDSSLSGFSYGLALNFGTF